jgi:hypothetical protein
MFHLLRAGLVAAGRQFCAVVLVTIAIHLIPSSGLVQWSSDNSAAERFWADVSPLLTCSYLLTAMGLAFTSDRSVRLTAESIYRASRLMRLSNPKHALMALAAQLGLAAAVFAIFTLRPPPEALTEVAGHLTCSCVVLIGWAGVMSMGVAGFGASAHAVRKAL